MRKTRWATGPNNARESSIKRIENFPLNLPARKLLVILMRMNF